MLPIIHLGPFHIPSYSLMLFLGVIAFTVVTILLYERKEHTPRAVTNRVLLLSIPGIASLGLFALIFNSLFHSIEEGRLVIGGITWLGGVLGAFPTILLLIHFFCPRVKGEALFYFDLLIPGITLAHGLGRIGCFLGGCCYGVVTDSFLGVSFPEGSAAALQYPAEGGGSLPVLPSQLIEAGFEILLFCLMLLLYRFLRRHLFVTYAFAYGTFRFILEFFRGDSRGATGFALSPSQFMSILLVLGGILVLLYSRGLVFRKLKAKMDHLILIRNNAPPSGKAIGSEANRLRKLKALREEELITEEEYKQKKAEILSRL